MCFLKCLHFLELALVFILNQWYSISCFDIPVNINGDVLESMLQQARKLKGNDFASWKIEDGVPVLVGVNQTHNDNAEQHIVLQRIRENLEEWNLCYWNPSYNYLPRDYVAPAYTMALDQVLNENSSYHYSTESKGIEGGHLLNMFNVCLIGGKFKKFGLKTRERRFVLLEEQNVVIIRQVSPMSDHLYTDSCAVFYSEINVYVFYGNEQISNRLKRAAYNLGNLVRREVQMYNPDVGYIEIEYGETAEGLSVHEIKVAVPFFNRIFYSMSDLSEIPELNNRNSSNISIIKKLWKGQVLITLSKDRNHSNRLYAVKKGPLFKSMLKTDECHIILYLEKYHDGKFFLWIGSKSTIEDRIRAAIKVERTVVTILETYWDRINYTEGMTVPVVVEGKEPLEFKAIFIDWIDEENHNYIKSLVDTVGNVLQPRTPLLALFDTPF